jgi:hypothetical protein
MLTVLRRCIFGTAILLAAPLPARAVNDEIQVYNAEIAKVGQWTFQLHSNYAFSGRKEPDFPGGIIPNHALNGTGEWVASSRFPFPYVADQDSPDCNYAPNGNHEFKDFDPIDTKSSHCPAPQITFG